MVKKLLKHEFKNSYLEITILNGAIIGLTLIIALIINVDQPLLIALPIISLFSLYFAAYILLIINIVKSFSQKLFSKEGYLTLTIPVSIDKIIISKFIVNIIWYIITTVVFLASLLTIVFTFSGLDVEALNFLKDLRVIDLIPLAFFVLNSLIAVILLLSTLFFTLCVLNVGKIHKFKLLIGVAIYYGISMVISWAQLILGNIIGFGLFYNDGEFNFSRLAEFDLFNFLNYSANGIPIFSLHTFIINILAIIGLYFLGRRLITKKLELE